jgi:hypothetical protein
VSVEHTVECLREKGSEVNKPEVPEMPQCWAYILLLGQNTSRLPLRKYYVFPLVNHNHYISVT